MSEQDLINMGEDFKNVVNKKDREIRCLKNRCNEADEELRYVKDSLIESKIFIDQIRFLAMHATPPAIIIKIVDDLLNRNIKMQSYIDNVRDSIDFSDLTEDFFLAFEDQI